MLDRLWVLSRSTLLTSTESRSHATATRRYNALGKMSTELDHLSSKLAEKMGGNAERSYGTSIPSF